MTSRPSLALCLLVASAANPASGQEWPVVGGDAAGTKHSALAQIRKDNVARLEVAWTFDTGDWSDGTQLPSRSAFEATPLVIDGVLYVPSPFGRLFALEAGTGEQRWVFDPRIDKTVPRNLYVNRGVASWTDGRTRFLDSVVALECATGKHRWHFQAVHHDVWDYDLPAPPVLVTVARDGKAVPAVAQVTKMGFVFVLDRETVIGGGATGRTAPAPRRVPLAMLALGLASSGVLLAGQTGGYHPKEETLPAPVAPCP